MQVDLGLAVDGSVARRSSPYRISGECDFGSIGRNYREGGNGPVGRELLLIGAVRVHGPNLFVAGPVGDEIDSRSHETAGAEDFQDVGSELLRDFLCAQFIDGSDIYLRKQLRRGGIRLLDIVEPSIKHQLVVLDGGISESEIVGVDWRPGPIRKPRPLTLAIGGWTEVGGLLRNLQWVGGLRDH